MKEKIIKKIAEEQVNLFFKNKFDITDLTTVQMRILLYVRAEVNKNLYFKLSDVNTKSYVVDLTDELEIVYNNINTFYADDIFITLHDIDNEINTNDTEN